MSKKQVNIWGTIVYNINRNATRKNLDDMSHRGYFMGYAYTKGVIIYWKKYQPFVIHRAHLVWFDEYNSSLSIEETHTPGYLLLQEYPGSRFHNSDVLNLISCELDLTSTPFRDTKTLTSEIELSHSRNKFGFNLLDDENFIIAYITDTIPESPEVIEIRTQSKQMCGS